MFDVKKIAIVHTITKNKYIDTFISVSLSFESLCCEG